MTIESAQRALVDTDFVMTIDGRASTAAELAPVFNPATRAVAASVPVTPGTTWIARSRQHRRPS